MMSKVSAHVRPLRSCLKLSKIKLPCSPCCNRPSEQDLTCLICRDAGVHLLATRQLPERGQSVSQACCQLIAWKDRVGDLEVPRPATVGRLQCLRELTKAIVDSAPSTTVEFSGPATGPASFHRFSCPVQFHTDNFCIDTAMLSSGFGKPCSFEALRGVMPNFQAVLLSLLGPRSLEHAD